MVKRECPQVSDPSTESAKSDILPSNPHIIPVPSLSSSHGDGEPVTDTLRSIVKFEANQVGPMAKRSKIEHVDDFLMMFAKSIGFRSDNYLKKRSKLKLTGSSMNLQLVQLKTH